MVLGIVHGKFAPVSGRFKDYIARPKSNGYQSIHTTIEYSENQKVEIQIRTKVMHEIAEEGVAAHWKYKEKKIKDKNEKYYQAVKKMFAQKVTDEVLNETIFVFTPKGDVMELDNNSTALDFAFQVHTQIGYRTIGAKINDKIVPLDQKLENGDKVEILTSKATNGPGKDWLNMVNNNSSKVKIKKWFKDLEFENKVKEGQEILENEFAKMGLKFKELEEDEIVYLYMKKYNIPNIENLYYKFATNSLNLNNFIQKFKPKTEEIDYENILEEAKDNANKYADKNENMMGVKISGSDNTMFVFAKCCNPLPGVEIGGYVTNVKGIIIHNKTCQNLKRLIKKDSNREIEVYWDEKLLENSNCRYEYSFSIKSINREGLLYDILRIINEHKLDIINMNTMIKKKNGQSYAIMDIRIMIKNKENFEKLKKNLLSMKDVIDII